MKLETHIVFGVGVSSIVFTLSSCRGLCLLGGLGLVVLEQYLIDLLSHERRGGHVRRTKLFHSLSGVLFLSIVLSLIYSILIINSNVLDSILIVFPGVFIGGLSHLFLDALNPGGVYFRGRRVRLLSVEYDDFAWNILFQFLGLLSILFNIKFYID
ncbi:MAG: metal-dependent hydrolase [Desulfurococcales archaeon]|nr:metal-dependent hydrolase [Desulfurococcales archaeon]